MKRFSHTNASAGRVSWVDVLRHRAEETPGATAFAFLASGETVTRSLTYADLDRRARAIAAGLRERCEPGDRALLLFPSGLDFITTFFGCLYAEVVAVPAYPPRANESMHRLAAIVADADARVALTTEASLRTSRQMTPEALGDRTLCLLPTDTLPDARPDDWRERRTAGDALAFLQYTSGSTGQPKGVMLTHRNLLANQHMIQRAFRHGRGQTFASWLPLFHDMGLVGTVMQTVYCGSRCLLMPPTAFLQKPLRWLQLIARERVHTSGGPNFGYELCIQRTTPEERAALDLSCWRIAYNGAEPVAARTLERFAAAFAPAGFRAAAFAPCYGLAEASLLVSFKRSVDRPAALLPVDPARLAEHRAVRSRKASARTLVSSGRAAVGQRIVIVDPATLKPVPDGRVGEIWVRGPSIGGGYWNKPDLSREVFGAQIAGRARAKYLRTGDLGFLRDGELFVTGRLKDVIILRGQNHYPQDLEATAQGADPGLRPLGSVAFGITEGATEGVVIVQEVERESLRRLDSEATTARIRAALLREHEVAPAAVVLVKPSSLPKTSSGKMQRTACRDQFLAHQLAVVGEWRRDEAQPNGRAAAPAQPTPTVVAAATVPQRGTAALRQWLIERVAGALKISPAAVSATAPLQSLGLDSLATVALSGELADYLGRPVVPTIVYDFPTIERLAEHFAVPASVAEPTAPRADASADRDIAIIGLACRFPGGAVNPEAFWTLLRAGTDATSEIPADRWDVEAYYDANPETPGRMYVKRGAFLGQVDGFDPEFFGIAQRDAVALDPQHRLLLEVAWEALEDAGIAPGSAARSQAGVFVGVSFDDYARLTGTTGDPARIDAYSALGGARALAASRISYHLGLQGPSMLVDTLCSSSLLAVHLAVQSLRAGECRIALAGGANLILSPETTIASCKLRALASDGRCKTFDASADGYARGEGAGIVVLKRLRDALADGDPIAAVIRGSAVNHDGRSNGLTAPNGIAQEALLRQALADAGAVATDIGYVEAHGTGTVLGDPIEVQALGRVYGTGRDPASPLLLGAVKTNIGHLEAAAGIAGLIKTVLALRHRELPATIHYRTPNPYIPWAELPLRVADRLTPLASEARLAGVSSFGMGGTNVHVLLAAAPEVPSAHAPVAVDRPQHVFVVSGQTAAAAAANALAWADFAERHPDVSLADLCHTAATARDAFRYRTAIVVTTRETLVRDLRAWAGNVEVPVPAEAPAVAFLFTGQGSHYAGMARELYETSPAFRATVDRCAELFRAHLPLPLTEVIFAGDEARLRQTLYAQPAIFSIEVALGRLWLSWGVKPRAVFGHSIGEFAAACVAGVFSLEDAAKLVAAKARLTERLPAGGMLSAATSAERLASDLERYSDIEFAAFNGPSATTLAGPATAIQGLVEVLAESGVAVEHLPIAQAFHSRALEPILEEFTAVARQVEFRPPAIPLVTCLHGAVADDQIVTPGYWARQMREPVQFARGVQTLARELGCRVFLEIGPKPSLTSLGQSVLPRREHPELTWLPSLRPGRPDWTVVLGAMTKLYRQGVAVDWVCFDRGYQRRRLAGCPTYAFQRRRCWVEQVTPVIPRNEARTAASNDTHTYEVQWRPSPLTLGRPAPAAEWLLVSSDEASAGIVRSALLARGHAVRCVSANFDFGSAAGVAAVIVDQLPVEDVAAIAQRLLAASSTAARLWIVSRLGVATGHESTALNIAAAPLAGFARAFALEQPARWGGMFDCDALDARATEALCDELTAGSADDIVAWRNATRLVPRLVSHAAPAHPVAFRADRTYLITGGTGALGMAVARWLAERGVRDIALLSRRPTSPAAAVAIAELQGRGVAVRELRGDVGIREDVEQALRDIEAGAAPLAGVFHAAGVAGFEPLTTLSAEAFRAVLAPKVDGSRHLHELTCGKQLEHFVLFSSISSVWGSYGQTHYAAANAALDALAHERRRCGLPALSVNWGPWAEGGMVTSTAREELRRLGIEPLVPSAAVALLERLMSGSAPQVTAAHVDWSRLCPALTLRRLQPLLDEVAQAPVGAAGRVRSDILKRIHSADATARAALLETYLAQRVADVLGRDAGSPIDRQQGFFALGMDSLMAVELRAALETDLELELPATVAFDRANLAALHEEIARWLFAAPPVADPMPRAVVTEATSAPVARSEPIAVVGLGCRFPGNVSSPAEFWELLRKGGQGLEPVPSERWSMENRFHPDPEHLGTMYVREFGFIRGVELFDHAFFNIFPREAATMDPQQRLLLETAWEALESAGLANARLRGSATGTFVGVSHNDYAQRLLKAGDARIDAYFGTGNALNAVAGRIAYTFGLRGPTMVTDTACSSSLVALHQACQSLRAGECETALAAGVNLMLAPEPAIALSRARMLAPDGRCKTFDATADGYGRGEGCGVVVLQPLSVARAAGRPILAVVAGSAVNQDGAGSGFTVPNGHAQQELILRALTQAGRTPDELDYVEAHGTGTPLGDPIEINALASVVGSQRKRPLLVGSVKTNLGHLESAAGIAGVIKTVLALHHGALPAHLNFSRPSPRIAWEKMPIRVPTVLTPWEQAEAARPRVAGVSAFGFTGTNAHVILESAPATEAIRAESQPGTRLVPLSARTAEALRALRVRVLAWLDAHPETPLADVARTLGAGRSHFAFRECYLVETTADLRERLRAAAEVIAAQAPGLRPIAFVCESLDALRAAESWRRWGVAPATVVGTGTGLLAAAVLAGVFSADEAERLASDAMAIASITPRAPRLSLFERNTGRIADHNAGSRAWWVQALRTGAIGNGELLQPHLQVALDATLHEPARLRAAAELYLAGVELDWSALAPDGRHRIDAPTYAFQRRRHWVDVVAAAAPTTQRASDPDTLLGRRLVLPGSREIRFAAEYSAHAGFLAHHRLFGRMIASAAQQIAFVIAASDAVWKAGTCTISHLAFPSALLPGEDEVRPVQLLMTPSEGGLFAVQVMSAAPGQGEQWPVHLTGHVEAGVAQAQRWPTPAAGGATERSREEIYREMARLGYTLGPSFRWIASARQHGNDIVAELSPDDGAVDAYGYHLHPGLLDSCFQLIGLCAGVESDELHEGGAIYIPAAIERIEFHRRAARGPLTCHARLTDTDHRRTHRLKGELQLVDADGALVCTVSGFEARRAPRAAIVPDAKSPADLLYQLTWRETPLPSEVVAPQTERWSFIGADPSIRTLAERFQALGHEATCESEAATAATAVVLFVSDDDAGADERRAAELLTRLQTLAGRQPAPRVWIVTRGAQAIELDHTRISIAGAAAAGLARIAAVEHPELRIALIDLTAVADPSDAAVLERELLASTDENQVAWRGGRRFSARFAPHDPMASAQHAHTRLVIGQYGNLDTLALHPAEAVAPAPNEVVIEVRAAGLNFRDVLNALGLLQAHLAALGVGAASQLPFGGECAGIVRSVGSAVRDVRPGDEVVAALATGSMGSHVAVDERFVVRKPAGLSFAEAATLPVAYLTAYYALYTLAKVQPGERVLVHAAAGGVGIAAIHVARLLGAEVLATASPAKWPQIRALGVTIIGHSRNTDYGHEFPPVDVVLNSLVEEHIPTSLDLLKPGGRFVEIGKLGIWTAEQVAARRPDVAYLPFDLVELSRRSPEVIERVLRELSPHWTGARLPALPLQVFALADAANAFRFMSQARHVGKVVLVPRVPAPKPRADGVYLVTGGLGGIGLAVGEWLAREGAGTVVLAGRRAPTPAQETVLAECRARGTTLVFHAADLARPGAGRALVERIVGEFGALHGVYHTAGVLDDGVLAQQTPDRLAGVFAAKARAAWELHLATVNQPVEAFVLFSSLAAVLGSPGQSIYAAANAALDALAHLRQRSGRAALSVNWGPWAEAGMSARLDERSRARLAAFGLKPLARTDALRALAEALARGEPQLSVVDLDARALLASAGASRVPPLLRELGSGRSGGDGASGALLGQLRSVPATEREGFLVSTLSARLTSILGLGAGETLAVDRDLTALGFDSLTAVELKGWIAGEFGVEVPMQQIAGLSLRALAVLILGDLHLVESATVLTSAESIEDVLRADARLPDEIRPTGAVNALVPPREALLTGATGFLGAFLLDELLRQTPATVHCLVRAASMAEGRKRVLDNLSSYGLSTDVPAERLQIVLGDLAAPGLGLEAGAFERLAGELDAIYHNGAWLNFFYPYEKLKPSNVLGTLEVLRLATRGRTKAVHYVSTSGVFYSRHYRGRALPESDAAEECAGHALGYSQSKWVAERLVTAAAERGVPVTVHRAPFITGHQQTGMWNTDDFICRLVRGIVRLGAMPDLAATMDIVPVDYVARAIVQLSQDETAAAQRFHLCAENVAPWSALGDWLKEQGYAVQRESYAEWLARLPALRNTDHPLAPFLPLFLEKSAPNRPTVPEVFLQSAHARLDATATAARLAAKGLAAPVIDSRLWHCYLGGLQVRGLLAAPGTPPTA